MSSGAVSVQDISSTKGLKLPTIALRDVNGM